MDILSKANNLLNSLKEQTTQLKLIQSQIDSAILEDQSKLEYLYSLEFKTAMNISSTFESLNLIVDNIDGNFNLRRIKQQAEELVGVLNVVC